MEQILQNRGLYVQPGRPGDRLKDDPQKPKIIVEVADTGFKVTWDKLFLAHAALKLRRKGMKRGEAMRAAKEVVERIRKVASMRPFTA